MGGGGGGVCLTLQVTSDRESLVKHYGYYTRLYSSGLHKSVCLRLNKFSLSQIGFVERLLWVQMLDLSQNELRSIEGHYYHAIFIYPIQSVGLSLFLKPCKFHGLYSTKIKIKIYPEGSIRLNYLVYH